MGSRKTMSLDEALKILNIEDYKERIVNSNSNGELFYLVQYIELAKLNRDNPARDLFRGWFIDVVKYAEKHWERPESIFQWIDKVYIDHAKQYFEKKIRDN
jgi:hypothetical protein